MTWYFAFMFASSQAGTATGRGGTGGTSQHLAEVGLVADAQPLGDLQAEYLALALQADAGEALRLALEQCA